jgi:hypothetical protein
MDGFLVKPLERDRLAAALDALPDARGAGGVDAFAHVLFGNRCPLFRDMR